MSEEKSEGKKRRVGKKLDQFIVKKWRDLYEPL